MRRLALVFSLFAALLLPAAAAHADASAGDVSSAAAKQALERALDVFREPMSAASGPAAGSRDATLALRDLAVALPALSGADRRRAQSLLSRPTDKNDRAYFGKEAAASPVCDAHFCIHWTDNAKNAPVNGAFLGAIGESVDLSRTVENDNLGWRSPKSDGRLGGRKGRGFDGQTDVYVTNLGKRLYGYAAPDGGQRGQKRYAYLVLDNDYVGFPTGPLDSMRVTVAHEYNHILQFNYDVFENVWLFEDTATWMEDKVYPAINDYLNYLPTFAKRSSRPMTGSSIKIYAEAVWNHWLSAKYGNDVIRNTWEVSPKQKSFAVASYEKSIKNAGGPGFSPELGDFFAATAEWRTNTAFPDYSEYPDMKRAGNLGGNTVKTKLDNTSYRLYDVNPAVAPSVTLSVKAEKGTKSSISLVGRVGGVGPVTTETTYLKKGGKGTVTLDTPAVYSRITAVVANVDGSAKRSRGKLKYTADNSSYRVKLAG
ncbi:MAG: MXAN_6640 family putative metalloprotease [Solirubrobacterales bacterium]